MFTLYSKAAYKIQTLNVSSAATRFTHSSFHFSLSGLHKTTSVAVAIPNLYLYHIDKLHGYT